jgi:hypothetical protein
MANAFQVSPIPMTGPRPPGHGPSILGGTADEASDNLHRCRWPVDSYAINEASPLPISIIIINP